jgi:hypothetical protein
MTEVRKGIGRFGLYAVAFAGGQAATHQLIACGNKVGYQHFLSVDRMIAERPSAACILIVEAMLVLLASRRVNLFREVRRIASFPAILAILLVTFATSAAPSKEPKAYALELLLATVVQLLHLAVLVSAFALLPSDRAERWSAGIERVLASRRLPIACGAFVLVLASALAWLSYERHPHVPDEVVYLYHARYLARGMLTMPLPRAAEAFNVDLMMYQGDVWYCPVPIGWPAMLAPFAFAGLEWLANPVLAAAGVPLAHGMFAAIYGKRTASIAAIFIATSPWYVLLAMSFMTHTFTMFACIVAGWALSRVWSSGRLSYAALSGAAIGVLSLIRPLEGVAAAVTLGLWALTFGSWRERLARTSVMGIGTVIVGAIQLPYNRALTGDALQFPLMLYTDRIYGKDSNALGFGPNRGLGWHGLDPFPGHGPKDVVVNAILNAFQIQCELLGWSIGSLLLVLILVATRRMRRADVGFLLGGGLVVFLHSFYWFSGGPDFGARYWFLTFLPLIALSARGFEVLEERVPSARRSAVLSALALVVVSAAITYFPWRGADKYHHYRLMRPDVRRLAEEHDFGRALVIVRGRRHPDYASAVTYNPVDFSDPVPIYAWDKDRPELRRLAIEAYPDRRVFVVNGPSITGRGFEVLGGPYASAAEVESAIAGRP